MREKYTHPHIASPLLAVLNTGRALVPKRKVEERSNAGKGGKNWKRGEKEDGGGRKQEKSEDWGLKRERMRAVRREAVGKKQEERFSGSDGAEAVLRDVQL